MIDLSKDGRSEVNFVRKMETFDKNDLDIKNIKEVFIMTQHHKRRQIKNEKKKLQGPLGIAHGQKMETVQLNQDRSKRGENPILK